MEQFITQHSRLDNTDVLLKGMANIIAAMRPEKKKKEEEEEEEERKSYRDAQVIQFQFQFLKRQ